MKFFGVAVFSHFSIKLFIQNRSIAYDLSLIATKLLKGNFKTTNTTVLLNEELI